MKRRAMFISVLLVLAIALLSGCDQAPPVRPTSEPGAPLLVFERIGGIAGFQDKLVIGYSGEYYLERQGQEERIGLLSKERRAQLENWLDHFAPLTLRLEDNPGGPDNLLHQLVWTGRGTATANHTQQDEMLNWATSLLDELSAAAD